MPTPYIMIKKEVDVTEIRYIHSIWQITLILIQEELGEPRGLFLNHFVFLAKK